MNKTIFYTFIFSFLILFACAPSGIYFTGNHTISDKFENGFLFEGYQYYAGGPKLKPNALVAIKPSYTLDSPHWRKIQMTKASLTKLTATVKFVPGEEFKITPNGAYIFTPDGDEIGVWYSVYRTPPAKLIEGAKVYIAAPEPRMPTDFSIRRRDRN